MFILHFLCTFVSKYLEWPWDQTEIITVINSRTYHITPELNETDFWLSLLPSSVHKFNFTVRPSGSTTSIWMQVFCSVLPEPTFQHRINVVSALWINVEITLIRRWKWNKIRRRIFNVARLWYNVSARHWNNVETTLHNVCTTLMQCCFNLVSRLVKAILNPIGLVMIVDCEIVEYMLNTWIVFILLNEKIFFYYILTIQLLMKYQKFF